jgi:16S rRNA (cytidine1402-2'-O)-methyltransferase
VNKKGCLYLIPNTIGNDQIDSNIPIQVQSIIEKLDHFIVENEKETRKYIKLVAPNKTQENIIIYKLNKYTSLIELDSYLDICFKGKSIGLISDAGCPGIADPGALIVSKAHDLKIKIIPLVGPSSILLALMASGMNGQNFAFNGYLPINKNERIKRIKFFEKKSLREKQSQIFIETPYRNNLLFNDLINSLSNSTKLCIATDISLKSEKIESLTIYSWKRIIKEDLNKRPSIFIIESDF